MIPLETYQDQLCSIALDKSKFSKVRGIISGHAFIQGLQYDLFIQHEIHHLFLNKLTFETYVKVDERFRNMVPIPSED